MTHIKNIPHILQYGITHHSSIHKNPNFQAIGDNSLINKRNQIEIFNGKKLGDYIPFYFGGRMPMLYVIVKGFNNVQIQQQSEIVYCVSSVQSILDSKLPFLFTDGHAVDELSKYYEAIDAHNIPNLLDFAAIKAHFWKDENDLDLKRRKEAELLVEKDVPLNAILGYIVYDEDAKEQLIKEGISPEKIIIKPTYYF